LFKGGDRPIGAGWKEFVKVKRRNEFRRRISPVKQVFFCLVPLVVFLASTEAALRFFDLYNPYLAEDPFAGFEPSLMPGFIEAVDDRDYLCRNPVLHILQDNCFPAQVDGGTLRPAVLGGSNVVNFDIAALESAIAGSTGYDVNVVNAGANSYGSQRLAPLAGEVLDLFDIDLLILYMGHNEFLERRFYRHLIEGSPVIREIRIRLWRLHLYTCIRAAAREVRIRTIGFKEKEPWPVPKKRSVLPEKAEIFGVYENWQESLMVYHHFRFNLNKIGLLAACGEVPLLIVTPVSNDLNSAWSPCFHETRTPEEIEEFTRRRNEAWNLFALDNQTVKAIEILEKLENDFGPHSAVELDLNRFYTALGDPETALSWLRKSCDSDCSPAMANDRIAGILREFAEDHGHRLLDARTGFHEISEFGIVGHEVLADHCHLNQNGQEILFEMIAKEIAAMIENGDLTIE